MLFFVMFYTERYSARHFFFFADTMRAPALPLARLA